MIKDLFIKAVLFVSLFSLGFSAGYLTAKNEITDKVLENKKDCYDLEDLLFIIWNKKLPSHE